MVCWNHTSGLPGLFPPVDLKSSKQFTSFWPGLQAKSHYENALMTWSLQTVLKCRGRGSRAVRVVNYPSVSINFSLGFAVCFQDEVDRKYREQPTVHAVRGSFQRISAPKILWGPFAVWSDATFLTHLTSPGSRLLWRWHNIMERNEKENRVWELCSGFQELKCANPMPWTPLSPSDLGPTHSVLPGWLRCAALED